MHWWIRQTALSAVWAMGGGLVGFAASILLATVWGFQVVAEHGRSPGSDPLVGLALVWGLILAPLGICCGALAGCLCRYVWMAARSWIRTGDEK